VITLPPCSNVDVKTANNCASAAHHPASFASLSRALSSMSAYPFAIDVAVAETGDRTFPHRALSFAEPGMTLVRTHVSDSGMRSTIM